MHHAADVCRGNIWFEVAATSFGGNKNRSDFICGFYSRQKGILKKLSGQLSGAPDSIPEGPENGCPDKKKNSKLSKLGKSELTLKTPLPMVYRVKSSLQEL